MLNNDCALRQTKVCKCERCILGLLELLHLIQTPDVLPSGSSITFEIEVLLAFSGFSSVKGFTHKLGPHKRFSLYKKHTFFLFVPGSVVVGKGQIGGGIVGVLVLVLHQNSKL